MSDAPRAGVDTSPVIEEILSVDNPTVPAPGNVMTIRVTLPAGSTGAPAHRHPGPAFGYVVKGAIVFEIEGEPERIVQAGESFWEPGGDVIHYQDGNHLADAESQFIATMIAIPGEPMFNIVSQEELELRRDRRAPRP
jgi:quercetin dioxygenase-like cupin family protein